jgi:hypothetical protein
MVTLAGGAILGIAICVAAISKHKEAARMHNANQALKQELATLRTRAETLAAEKQESARQLEVVMSRHGKLASRVAELEAAELEDSAQFTSPPSIKPYQAEAFLGRKGLGAVWIVPRNLRLDTNTQRYVYEPVVLLDERLRKFFEVHHTNIVEQVVETPVYVNNNYFPEPYYNYYYGHLHGGRPTNGVPHPQPQPVTPPPFNPGSGTIIKQPLGTPAANIKTYPTAPKLPPVNAQPKQPKLLPPPGTMRTASI